MKQISSKYNVPAEIWNRYLQTTMSRLRFVTDTSKIQCPGSDMKQIPPKYNVPAQIWNRYLQNTMYRLRYETDIFKIQCPGWDMKQISPKYNVPAQIWTDASKIQCSGSDMKEISPKYNVPAEIWNRYLQNTMFRLRYETDTGTLLLERICSKRHLFLPNCGWREKGRRFKNTKQRKPLTCVAWRPTANQNSDEALHKSTKCSHFFKPLLVQLPHSGHSSCHDAASTQDSQLHHRL